jgi:hypothetical protein
MEGSTGEQKSRTYNVTKLECPDSFCLEELTSVLALIIKECLTVYKLKNVEFMMTKCEFIYQRGQWRRYQYHFKTDKI